MFKRFLQFLLLLILLMPPSVYSQGIKHKVLYGTPEMFPYTTIGGLSNVGGDIPEALVAEGEELTVVMPMWSNINKAVFDIKPTEKYIDVPMPWGSQHVLLYEGKLPNGVKVLFIGEPFKSNLFKIHKGRNMYYQTPEEENDNKNLKKVSFFSKAILEVDKMYTKDYGQDYFDIIHLHDWTTGLAAWYKKYDPRYMNIKAKVVYSIHNLGAGAQGIFSPDKLWLLEINSKYLDPVIPGSVTNYGSINLTKAGARSADKVTTVSKQYALDIKTQRYGNNLNGALADLDIIGVDHGVDIKRFDPSINNIKYNFDETNFTEMKAANKAYLQEKLGLPIRDVPMIIVTTRGDSQKNVELLFEALRILLSKEDIQVLIMGNEYEKVWYDGKDLFTSFTELSRAYAGKLYFNGAFDGSLQPEFEASADIQLIISDFEPAGLEPNMAKLNRVISIVHLVNGLKDAVVGSNDTQGRPQTGVIVDNLDLHGDKQGSIKRLIAAIYEALQICENPYKLQTIRNNMADDYRLWRESAREYIAIYDQLVSGQVGQDIQKQKKEKTITDPLVTPLKVVIPIADGEENSDRVDKITEYLNKKYGYGVKGYTVDSYEFNTSNASGVALVSAKGVTIVLKAWDGEKINLDLKDLPPEVFQVITKELRRGKRATEVLNLGSNIGSDGSLLTGLTFKNTLENIAVVTMLDDDERTVIEKILFNTIPIKEKLRVLEGGDLNKAYNQFVESEDIRCVLLMYIGEKSGSDTYIVNRTLEKLSNDMESSPDGRLSRSTLVVLANQDNLGFMKQILSSPYNKFIFQNKPVEIIDLFIETMALEGNKYNPSYYESANIKRLRNELRDYTRSLMK
ncbi:MAG: glycogen/starch synthase [bacterium]